MSNSGLAENKIFTPEKVQTLNNSKIREQLNADFGKANKEWKSLNPKSRENVNTFFQLELINRENENQKITPRVAQAIMQLWENNTNIQSNC